jgi:hypothetical protein
MLTGESGRKFLLWAARHRRRWRRLSRFLVPGLFARQSDGDQMNGRDAVIALFADADMQILWIDGTPRHFRGIQCRVASV